MAVTASHTLASFLKLNSSQPLLYSKKNKTNLIRCELSSNDREISHSLSIRRRQALFGVSSLFSLGTLLSVPVDNADAADIVQRFQRAEFLKILQTKLNQAIKAEPELVPEILRLALNDALTYDKATSSGGANGSIRFSEELKRPENAGLEAALKLLESVKAEVDAEVKGGPVSYADLIQFGGQAAVKRSFLEAAIKKAGGDEKKGRQLAAAFGSSSQWGYFEKQLGRADASEADPSGRVPVYSNASVEELKAKLAPYGFKARQLAVLSAFLGNNQDEVDAKLASDPETKPFVEKYRRSRETVSQTDYEVDLITTFTKIAVLGPPINYEAYTYERPRPKFKL